MQTSVSRGFFKSMMDRDDILQASLKTARNHDARAEEGRKLLGKGLSLDRMRTPIIGLTQEQLIFRRQSFIDRISGAEPERVLFRYKVVQAMLERANANPNKGTSELEWQRIMIEDIAKERRIDLNGD